MEGTIILDDKKINVIVDFINENFDNDLNILKVIKNYRNLLFFLKNNSYSINLIEADVLFSKCPILADNIAILSENLDDIDESVVSLFEYCELNITMNKSKDIVKKTNGKRTAYIEKNYNPANEYYNYVAQFDVLTKEEEYKLFERYKNGDQEVYDEIVNKNLKLVLYVARKFRGLEHDDLIQAGNIGLLKAIDKFDYTKGYKFSTYAVWWIKQVINRELYDIKRNIRFPVHFAEQYQKIGKIRENYINEHGHNPSIEELSDMSGLSIKILNDIEKYSRTTTSLNELVGEDKNTELGELIPDVEMDIENEVINSVEYSDFRKFFEETTELSPREKKVLKLRFGFYNNKIYTLEEVGKYFNVTRERIRQIELKARRKLKKAYENKANNNRKVLVIK